MSADNKARARCMGGRFCNHRPGECTADPVYQASLKTEQRISDAVSGADKAVEALKPVAWMYDGPDGEHYIREHRDICHDIMTAEGWTETPLYTRPDDHAPVLAEALKPFVEGYAHTSIFLRTREKMHSMGRDLYREDVERARAALQQYEARNG